MPRLIGCLASVPFLLIFAAPLMGQTQIVEVGNVPALAFGAAQAADFDGDGDMDVFSGIQNNSIVISLSEL